MSHRVDRSLLLERDPEKLGPNQPLESIRDAQWQHQKAAMMAGYNSVFEMAVDELLVMVREMQARLDALEGQTVGLQQYRRDADVHELET